MLQRFTVAVLLVVLGAVLMLVVRPQGAAAQAAAQDCSVPKSAGTFKGAAQFMVFETGDGTLNVFQYSLACPVLVKVIKRP